MPQITNSYALCELSIIRGTADTGHPAVLGWTRGVGVNESICRGVATCSVILCSQPALALIDTGSEVSLINSSFVQKHGITFDNLSEAVLLSTCADVSQG